MCNNEKPIGDLISEHRADYENACDDLYYGYWYNFWRRGNASYLSEEDAKRIWHAAFDKMANSDF